MSNDTTTQSLSLDELPAVVRAFTAAHLEHDLEREMVSFADDATVVDDGRTYSGVGEIRPWLARAAGEFTYTTQITDARRTGVDSCEVVHHLEGDFPGGVVDLHYRYVLQGDRIVSLVIEP